MSLGVKLSTFAAALILAGSAYAQDELCPSMSDIQAEGITMAQGIGSNYYVGYSLSEYNTSSYWGFAIGPVQGDSEDDAINASNEVLSHMFTPGLPMQLEDNLLVCLYNTGNPYIYSIAVQNYDGSINPMKLKQYLQKIH